MRLRAITVVALFCFLSISNGSVAQAADSDLSAWLTEAVPAAQRYLAANISPTDGLPGSVLASPSRNNPNYYYNWVRDAALVMDVYMRELEGDGVDTPLQTNQMAELSRSYVEDLIWNYLSFNKTIQISNAITGIGEPKFFVNGTPYMDNWGRPQNDGPGLRSSLLMRFMKYLMAHNRVAEAQAKVWPVVATDLNYLVLNATSPSFDLWEEFKGDNFFTLVVDRAALLAGAEMALVMADKASSDGYKAEAARVETILQGHLNNQTNQIVENLHRVDGIEGKNSGLDSATVLAIIHTDAYPFLRYDNGMVKNTVTQLTQKFQQIYPINLRSDIGPAFGRYPEDVYYGGNPWFLTTLAVAEYYYNLGFQTAQSLGVNNPAVNTYTGLGDSLLERTRKHVDAQFHMSEQMDRNSGYLLSASDLSWGYAALITAVDARTKLMNRIKVGP